MTDTGVDVVCRPVATLAPSTTYTFSVAGPGLTYQFSFTTGAALDTTPPRLIGISPDPSTRGVSPFGPFVFRFDKELLSANPIAFTATDGTGGNSFKVGVSLTADRRAIQVTPGSERILPIVQITVDPAGITDLAGNAGVGPPSNARFLTEVLRDSSTPRILAVWPEHGDTAVPTNAAIQLLFSRPIHSPSVREGGIVVEGAGEVLSFNANYNGGLVVLRELNLQPDTKYRVRITAKLMSADGLAPDRESEIEFRTATGPDPDPPGGMSYRPQGPLAAVDAPVVLRWTRRLPPFAPLLFTNPVAPLGGFPGDPLNARLLEDGRTLVLTSPDGSWPVWSEVAIDVAGLFDITGAEVRAPIRVKTSDSVDSEPPRLLATTPEDGAQDVPISIAPRIRLSEIVGLQTPDGAVRLTRNGEPVVGRISFPQSNHLDLPALATVGFEPENPLDPGVEYQLELSGVLDQAGNALPPQTIRFRTAGVEAAPDVGLRLLESNVESGELDPDQPIELRYDGPVRPASSFSTVRLLNVGPPDGGAAHPVELTVSGGLIRIAPLLPWPSGRSLVLSVNSEDRWSRPVSYMSTFRARASADTVRPEVVSISPPAGTRLRIGQPVAITFSEPMLDASAAGGGLFASQLTSGSSATVTWNADRTRAVMLPYAYVANPSSAPFSVAISAALTDLAGNPAKPYTATYSVAPDSAAPAAGYPSIITSWPQRSASGVDVRTPVVLYLSAAADVKLLNDLVWLVTPDGRAAGKWETSADGRLATFRPNKHWTPGVTVHLLQVEPVIRLNYSFSFQTAPPPPFTLAIRRTSLSGSHPANAPIDIEFTQDLASGVLPVVVRAGVRSPDTLVPCDEIRISARTVRLVPKSPLTPGHMLDIQGRETFSPALSARSVTVGPSLASTVGPAAVRAPAPGVPGMPRTVRIAGAWTSGVNPVSVSDATVRLVTAGREMPVVLSVSFDGAVVVAAPLEPLPADHLIEVTMDGIEDRLGRKYPPESWTFRTGSDIDVTAPDLLYSNVQNNVDPSTPVSLTFSEPLDPAQVAWGASGDQWKLSWQLSADLRTVSYAAGKGWNRGEQVDLSRMIADLSGNTASPNVRFTAGFDSDTTPPALRAISLRDGQTGVPMAGGLALLFNKPVPGGGIGLVRLTRGSEEVPLAVSSVAGNRVVLQPRFVLDPNTTYQLSVTGIDNSTTITFTTGELLNDAPLTALPRYSSQGARIEVQFSSPVDITTLMDWPNALTWVDFRGWTNRVPVAVTWSEDATVVQLTPAYALTAGVQYTLNLKELQSAGGAALTRPERWQFIAGEESDHTPARLTFTPADGSVDVPLGVRLQVAFSRAVLPPRVRLLENDVLVTQDTSVYGSRLVGAITLQWKLKPNTNYRIEVDAFQDDQGAGIPASSSSFRTGTTERLPALTITSTSPADGEAGVSPTAPWTFNFNNTLSPFVVLDSQPQANRPIPFRTTAEVEGSKLTLRPDPAWPAAATLTMVMLPYSRFGIPTVQDWTGQPLLQLRALTVRTAALNDPVPPVLESAIPAAGSTIPGGKAEITLRFSKPVSLAADALQVFYDSQKVEAHGIYSSDFQSITYTLSPPENSRVTIVGTDAIRDNADNAMTPFVLEYPTGDQPSFGPPTAKLVEPSKVSGVDPATGILVRFDRIMDPASVLSSLHVTQDGQNVQGWIEVLENGRSYRFHPSAPLNDGAFVKVFILPGAHDPRGQPYRADGIGYLFFQVARDPSASPLTMTYRGFGKTIPADEVLEAQFSQELDPASVDDTTAWLRRGNRLVPGSVSIRDGRILQFTPQIALEPGVEYVFTAGSGLRSTGGAYFAGQDITFVAEPPQAAPVVESVSETEIDGLRATRVRFSQPLSLLAPFEGASERRYSVDGREMFLLNSSDQASIEVKGRKFSIRNERKVR